MCICFLFVCELGRFKILHNKKGGATHQQAAAAAPAPPPPQPSIFQRIFCCATAPPQQASAVPAARSVRDVSVYLFFSLSRSLDFCVVLPFARYALVRLWWNKKFPILKYFQSLRRIVDNINRLLNGTFKKNKNKILSFCFVRSSWR